MFPLSLFLVLSSAFAFRFSLLRLRLPNDYLCQLQMMKHPFINHNEDIQFLTSNMKWNSKLYKNNEIKCERNGKKMRKKVRELKKEDKVGVVWLTESSVSISALRDANQTRFNNVTFNNDSFLLCVTI